MIANDFLAHILYHLALPKDKMELVKKHAQTFIALCATGGCLFLLGTAAGEQPLVPAFMQKSFSAQQLILCP